MSDWLVGDAIIFHSWSFALFCLLSLLSSLLSKDFQEFKNWAGILQYLFFLIWNPLKYFTANLAWSLNHRTLSVSTIHRHTGHKRTAKEATEYNIGRIHGPRPSINYLAELSSKSRWPGFCNLFLPSKHFPSSTPTSRQCIPDPYKGTIITSIDNNAHLKILIALTLNRPLLYCYGILRLSYYNTDVVNKSVGSFVVAAGNFRKTQTLFKRKHFSRHPYISIMKKVCCLNRDSVRLNAISSRLALSVHITEQSKI